jgi:hypothetical protein
VKRAFGKWAAYVAAATLLALAYWAGAETVAPGQQYADPWLPCLYVGSIFGGVAWCGHEYVGIVRDARADRRKRREP